MSLREILQSVKIGITCYPTFGGSGIVATELGLELGLRGHDVHFISYANPIRLDTDLDRIHYHEVEVTTYPLFQFPPYTLALASRMAEVAEYLGVSKRTVEGDWTEAREWLRRRLSGHREAEP